MILSTLYPFERLIEYSRLAGTVFAGGVTDEGDITGHTALSEAYGMGISV